MRHYRVHGLYFESLHTFFIFPFARMLLLLKGLFQWQGAAFCNFFSRKFVEYKQAVDTKFRNVCLDFDSAKRNVVGYLGTNLEFDKWLNE